MTEFDIFANNMARKIAENVAFPINNSDIVDAARLAAHKTYNHLLKQGWKKSEETKA